MLYSLCELAVHLVTMATQWSLGTRASHASAMVTVSTHKAEISVIVRQAPVCRVPGTPKASTVNAVSVDITALH